MSLWASIFEDDRVSRETLFGDFHHDPNRFSRTQVAVDSDGNILAAAAFWIRHIRDAQGTPLRAGHVWGVATHPQARRQGHARRLIERLIPAMRKAGCVVSILFAQEEAQGLYASQGWQSLPLRVRGGLLTGERLSVSPFTVREYNPFTEEAGWEPIARLYAAENTACPLSTIRDAAYWTGYIHWLFHEWSAKHCAKLLVAEGEAGISAYALVHFYDAAYAQSYFGSPPWFFINEIGARPGDHPALSALLSGLSARAKENGMGYGQVSLPDRPRLDKAIDRIFAAPLEIVREDSSAMIRSLTPEGENAVLSAVSTPDRFVWEQDRF